MTNPASLSDDDRAELIAYLDGELDEKASHELEARLSRDPQARAELDALRRTWDMLDFLPQPEPSASFTHRTLERVTALRPAVRTNALRRWRPWAIGVGWAAAVVLAGLGGYAVSSRLVQPVPTPAVAGMDLDEQLIRDLRLVENRRLYEHVDDLDFLWALADPELFGDES
jgi:anti-sigma factor RsiW